VAQQIAEEGWWKGMADPMPFHSFFCSQLVQSIKSRFFMAEKVPQTYKNHARLDPSFHIVLAVLLLASLILSIIVFVHHPGVRSSTLLVVTIALLLNSVITRNYSLKVQTRVIRLEERLRLAALLPESEKPRIPEFTIPQLVALRFASDAELPALAMRSLNEGLTNKQIKVSIQSWRADTFRV
jgi:Family of unknown function (DUF6526)